MDVLMTVLVFFVIISMTLTGTKIPNVTLPTVDEGVSPPESTQALETALIIGLNDQNEIIHNDLPISKTELVRLMRDYQRQTPDGLIILKADRSLDYAEILALLNQMKDIGGNKVSLAVEQ